MVSVRTRRSGVPLKILIEKTLKELGPMFGTRGLYSGKERVSRLFSLLSYFIY